MKHHALAAGSRRAKVLQFGAALRQLLHHHAGIGFIEVNDDLFDRLEFFAGRFIGAQDDARAPDGQLKTFPPHGLDQDAQLQFAAAGHFESIGFRLRRRDAQRDVAFRFAQQPLANDAALNLVALLAGQGPIVDAEGHREGGRINRLGGDGIGDGRITDRVGNGCGHQSGNGDDIARQRLFHRVAL